jgi:hypothetical protein
MHRRHVGLGFGNGRGVDGGGGGELDDGGNMSVVLRAYSGGRASRDWLDNLCFGSGLFLIKLQERGDDENET